MHTLQKEIIETLKVKPSIDPQEEFRRSVDFVKAYLTKYSFLKSAVLGISGGQDSTLAGYICQTAINELNEEHGEGTYEFIAVRLPYGDQADEEDCKAAIEFTKPNKVVRVNIKDAVDASEKAVKEAIGDISDFVKGNTKARERMKVQYDIAAACSGVVVGTDHAAEAVTGFYTKFGDGAADIIPLYRLNKRQGKSILKMLGCPEHLYEKAPTADLESDRPQLPDEEALGVTYDAIDDYLEGKQIAEKDAQTIEKWFEKTRHKREEPITVFDEWWKK
ncbi:ammonia-dependent NAD(+) synthetase [Gracilibacillus sp. S3-1-1]|uniref:Ammonia-dependent NAD(+) synthetase n=1 Tax=Gracilibacillus pellucidus TaxID=3095368 RepID=A0ACC6M649_9BACI|nr:ammonia-dependent NAD(+) synthetase [Gracilibacillus sp. S3-1-1]MDX8046424.1 ammonia-dependent NAD(+) synthetase [Gracilibacillus sp. S3-1-1]